MTIGIPLPVQGQHGLLGPGDTAGPVDDSPGNVPNFRSLIDDRVANVCKMINSFFSISDILKSNG